MPVAICGRSKRAYLRGLGIPGALLVVLALVNVSARASTNSTETVTVGSMAAVMDALVARYGYLVTLETPRYVFGDDLEDQSAQSRNDKGNGPRILMSRSISLTMTLPPPGNTGLDGLESILKKVAQDTGSNDHGAHYRVEREGDVFHIIAAEVRDSKGRWAAYTPILDTPISIPIADRSLYESLNSMCMAVQQAAHVPVEPLQIPFRALRNARSTVGANNEPARTVLTRLLAGSKMTWRIFYDDASRSYFLSVFLVPNTTITGGN
jgi:hypothetical protein